MITQTRSSERTGCGGSCSTTTALFCQLPLDHQAVSYQLNHQRRSALEEKDLDRNVDAIYSQGLGTLLDSRRVQLNRPTACCSAHWPWLASEEDDDSLVWRPTNASIHQRIGKEGLCHTGVSSRRRQFEKQPPFDRPYNVHPVAEAQVGSNFQLRRTASRPVKEEIPQYLPLSLPRPTREVVPPENYTDSFIRPHPTLTMGQRFGRQQQQTTSHQNTKCPSSTADQEASEEDKSISAFQSPRHPPKISSLQLTNGQYVATGNGHQNQVNMNGASTQWWTCGQLNGSIPNANDHFYHEYLHKQPYATIMKSKMANTNRTLQQIPCLVQDRPVSTRNLAVGDRLATVYDDDQNRLDRQTSPCRQILDACANFELMQKAQKKQWEDIPATPRLVRTNKFRQQTTNNSPLASTPLLQKRHLQSQQSKNASNYWSHDEYMPGGIVNSTPSYPSSPIPSRNTGRVLPLCSLESNNSDSRTLSQSSIVTAKARKDAVCAGLALDPPPPTPEEAEDCLAAHLRVICHEPHQQSLPRKQQQHLENWNTPQLMRRPFDARAAQILGSTDVLLTTPRSSQHSIITGAMPTRHPIQRSSQQPVPLHQHPSGLRQSQESLLSLMSTSTVSMAVAPGAHVRNQPYQQSGAGSSVGSQSPSVFVRGPGRHSHHYGGQQFRGAPASSCGSSSRGSSECNFNMMGPRRHAYRRSARNLNVRIPSVDNGAGKKAMHKSMTNQLSNLKPLPFEVPCVESNSVDASTIFVGRDWIFHELHEILVKAATAAECGMKGAVVYGGVGTGKTAIIHQLASYSPFLVDGEHCDDLVQDSPTVSPHCINGSPSSDRATAAASTASIQPKNRTSNSTDSGFVSGSKLSLNNKNGPGTPSVPMRHAHPPPPPRPPLPDWHRSVCQSIVAYHFCQIENQITCTVPDFLKNLASMFACAPQLSAYRETLCEQSKLRRLLSMDELLKNPIRSFRLAVTEPLIHLRKCGKIGQGNHLILIDGLDEAEFHRPEFGDSIASFLVKHALTLLPDWLKLVLTVKTASVELLKGMPLHKISLDDTVIDEWVFKDSKEYIRLRISQSSNIQTNISNTKAPSGDPIVSGQSITCAQSNSPDSTSSCPLARFAGHLASGSRGNFLYLKMTLNLIEKNYLVMKGANYKVLPINLSEVFLLMFNLRFPTARAFERVAPILNAVLASLRPLNEQELYEAVAAAGTMHEYMSRDEFMDRLKVLDDYLVKKQDGTFVLFHPAFRDWLIRREDGQSPKYLCDLRYGHALLALRLSRFGRRLSAAEMQELGHHLLKAHIYKRAYNNQARSESEDSDPYSALALFGRDCQLLWLNQVAADLKTSLCTQRNACFPNSKVSRLLLLAGASADAQLIDFRLDDIDQNDQPSTATADYATADAGSVPLLCSAAFYGQQEFASLLLEFGADVCATETCKGRSPLMLAAAEGHLDMVQMLHQHGAKLSQIDNDHRCAIVHAAERGHANVVSFLLQCDWTELGDNRDPSKVSMATSTYGYALRQQAAQQSFVIAASSGRTSICEFLLDFGDVLVDEADPVGGETALSAACWSARKETVGYLLNRAGARAAYGRQAEKPTPPLLQAVANGCWEIVSTLLARQMDVDGERNGSGQTALMIAAQHGHIAVLELLLSRNVDVSAVDDDGRTALYWACLKDQPVVATMLLDRGASLQTFDKHGFGPIHYAAQHGSKQLMQLLLDRCPQLLETPTNSSSRLRPLDLAILADNVDAVQRCLKKGAKLAPSTWTFARDKLSMIAALLNKLLEDGQLLYKRNRLEDAQHRFTYALKKIPQPPSASSTATDTYAAQWSEYAFEFDRSKFLLQLGYARCQRKRGDPHQASDTCTEAISKYEQVLMALSSKRKPEMDECLVDAYVCRARCFCELRQFKIAAEDLRMALRVSPTNEDAKQLLPKVKLALDTELGAKMKQMDLNSGSSLLSVYTPPQSSRESSLPVITDTETNDSQEKNATIDPSSSISPNRSQASSDSGNMPDLEDGDHGKDIAKICVNGKSKNGVETRL